MKMEAVCFLNRQQISTRLQGVTSQATVIANIACPGVAIGRLFP